MIQAGTPFSFQVDTNERLDLFLSAQLPGCSRSFCQKLIDRGLVWVNERIAPKASMVVHPADVVRVFIPAKRDVAVARAVPADLGVTRIYENEQFLIIGKPAGLIVHDPIEAFDQVTLVDWLLTHVADIERVGVSFRPGIVHRLDKDTSGIMVIPKNNYSHEIFADLFKNRQIRKTYVALVQGYVPDTGTITLSITRHPTYKHKMATGSGRDAHTDYIKKEQYADVALLELYPRTGRTHQIRVHCAAIGHPIVGDSVYGTASPVIKRQALHAQSLSFLFEGTEYSFSCPVPEDFARAQQLISEK